jgi:hypothetical protein
MLSMELPTYESHMHPIDCAFHLIVYTFIQIKFIQSVPYHVHQLSYQSKTEVQSHRGHIYPNGIKKPALPKT